MEIGALNNSNQHSSQIAQVANHQAAMAQRTQQANRVQPANKPEAPQKLEDKTPEESRRELLEKAAENYKSNLGSSNVRFTIYKDPATGQFVTRYTNLSDGSVTYVPEQDLLANLSVKQNSGGAMVMTEA